MTGRERRILDALVALHDETGGGVDAARIAARTGEDRTAVREALATLRDYDLAERSPEGRHLPTVTGREFLELDLGGDSFVVLEVVEEADPPDKDY